MSKFEHKVAATREFLQNRASLNRLTSHREVGIVIGELLANRHQRRIATPVSREKVIKVLRAIDDESVAQDGIMLSALVVHFWDNEPGHRFYESAMARGLLSGNANFKAFHQEQLAKIATRYSEFVPVNSEGSSGTTTSVLDEYEESDSEY